MFINVIVRSCSYIQKIALVAKSEKGFLADAGDTALTCMAYDT